MIRVPPFHYIHVLDKNANVKRVEVGPQTFVKQDHEDVVLNPTKNLVLPPMSYCIIQNPYVRKDSETKEPKEQDGQVMLQYGQEEIRMWDEWRQPFPLVPGESLKGSINMMETVAEDSAILLVAKQDFEEKNDDGTKTARIAGDMWLFYGPKTYRPRIEEEIKERRNANVIEHNHALKLKAIKDCVDCYGNARKAGEEWLIRKEGSYLPGVFEQFVEMRNPYFLTETSALQLRALNTFTDIYGKKHLSGEEWLVTHEQAEAHIQGIYEQVVNANVHLSILQSDEYCIVEDPVINGENQFGTKQLRKGVTSFFLLPGERLAGGIQKIYTLRDNEALLIKAQESFRDEETGQERHAGDLWLHRGPGAYTPRIEVKIIEKRTEMPMASNEGMYVRDVKTAEVRAVQGRTYMLESHEEKWNKELPKTVEEQIAHANKSSVGQRVKSNLVTYRPSYNSAVQIYDYKTEKLRVAFGPDLVTLAPNEQFSVFSLSGDTPKRPHLITTLELRLGPDFMTDVVELETSDHARLKVKLSYNWHFVIDHDDETKIFQVKDFVGDSCKALASKVRGSAASITFEEFHKNSARIIRKAVFGENEETKKINDSLTFSANNLCITNVDIQSVEPVDERTRESLQKSVQLAIEITTRKQERKARFAAEEEEQKAKAELDCQKIINLKAIETEKQNLVEKKNACSLHEALGQATAEANGRDTKLRIEADMSVKQATLAVQAADIERQADLEETKRTKEVELAHQQVLNEMAMAKARALADIETKKFEELVSTITPKTIQAIARAGPEMQARLLKGLGIKGYLMTDGNSPINLFNAAKGMVAAPSGM